MTNDITFIIAITIILTRHNNYCILSKTLLFTQAHVLVSTSLDEIAWVFNIRGSDVPCNPVSVSYAVIARGKGIKCTLVHILQTCVRGSVCESVHVYLW